MTDRPGNEVIDEKLEYNRRPYTRSEHPAISNPRAVVTFFDEFRARVDLVSPNSVRLDLLLGPQ